MPAVSIKQQRLFGMVHAAQKGKLKNPSKQVADIAKSIKPKDAKDFASTKHKGLVQERAKEAHTRRSLVGDCSQYPAISLLSPHTPKIQKQDRLAQLLAPPRTKAAAKCDSVLDATPLSEKEGRADAVKREMYPALAELAQQVPPTQRASIQKFAAGIAGLGASQSPVHLDRPGKESSSQGQYEEGLSRADSALGGFSDAFSGSGRAAPPRAGVGTAATAPSPAGIASGASLPPPTLPRGVRPAAPRAAARPTPLQQPASAPISRQAPPLGVLRAPGTWSPEYVGTVDPETRDIREYRSPAEGHSARLRDDLDRMEAKWEGMTPLSPEREAYGREMDNGPTRQAYDDWNKPLYSRPSPSVSPPDLKRATATQQVPTPTGGSPQRGTTPPPALAGNATMPTAQDWGSVPQALQRRFNASAGMDQSQAAAHYHEQLNQLPPAFREQYVKNLEVVDECQLPRRDLARADAGR